MNIESAIGVSIVNIASVSSLVGAVSMVPYSAAKGGIIALHERFSPRLPGRPATGEGNNIS